MCVGARLNREEVVCSIGALVFRICKNHPVCLLEARREEDGLGAARMASRVPSCRPPAAGADVGPCRAVPQQGPVHPKVTFPAPCHQHRALLQVPAHPETSGRPLGERGSRAPRAGSARPGAPRASVGFIYGVTYVILSIFLTFPEKR